VTWIGCSRPVDGERSVWEEDAGSSGLLVIARIVALWGTDGYGCGLAS